MNLQIILPLEDLNKILDAARRVPEMEAELQQLKRSNDGLKLLYSQILETLRNKQP